MKATKYSWDFREQKVKKFQKHSSRTLLNASKYKRHNEFLWFIFVDLETIKLVLVEQHGSGLIQLSRTHGVATAVDWQRSAGDKGRLVARQEKNGIGKLINAARATERVGCLWVFQELGVSRFIHASAFVQIRYCDTWKLISLKTYCCQQLVSSLPGFTELTRTFLGANSRATHLVNWSTAAFDKL